MSRDQVIADEQPPQTALQKFLDTAKEAVETARDVSNSHHMAPLHAFIRQGADEISQALKAFPDSMTPVAEPGQIFEPTSQEVFLNKTGRELEIDMGH